MLWWLVAAHQLDHIPVMCHIVLNGRNCTGVSNDHDGDTG